MTELLTIDEALGHVLQRSRLLPVENVPIDEALGRVLREPGRAGVDLPPFPSSAMDGFAVRSADTPGRLPVAYRAAAGGAPPGPLRRGTAAGIATGGTVPEGADAVVPVERVEDHGGHIDVPHEAILGQHVRQRGGDVRADDVVVAPGTQLGAVQIGALGAVGLATVVCSSWPRVAILATGNELRNPGENLEPGQIFESNKAMIAAALASSGAEMTILPVATDDPEAHRAAIAQGLEYDVLVTSGGVSMGPYDLVRRVAAEIGVDEVFWGVAIKPGKPLAFGVRGDTLMFGLPGNPVSSLVAALAFVRPALLARQGAGSPGPGYLRARVTSALRRNPHRDEFVRAMRTEAADEVGLAPIVGQESHMIARAAAADALIHVPRGEGELQAGEMVRFLPLD